MEEPISENQNMENASSANYDTRTKTKRIILFCLGLFDTLAGVFFLNANISNSNLDPTYPRTYLLIPISLLLASSLIFTTAFILPKVKKFQVLVFFIALLLGLLVLLIPILSVIVLIGVVSSG